MKRRSGRVRIGLLLFLLVGCDRPEGDDATLVTVDTLPDGTVHVINRPDDSTVGSSWTLREELRIGLVDDDGPASFGLIKGIAVTADGRLAVLDAHAQEIRVFDASGRHLATHGRQGQGPGEFSGASGLMLGPDEKLWVPDHANARMSVVDFEKGFVTSYPMRVRTYAFVWEGAMLEDGRIVEPTTTVDANRTNILLIYDQQLRVVDSLPLPTSPPVDPKNPPGSFYWEGRANQSSGYAAIPFHPRVNRWIDGRGLIWSSNGDGKYRFKRWTPGGDTTLIIETTRSTLAVTPTERDSAIDHLRAYLREHGAPDADWSRIPKTKPAIDRMFPGANGQVWVETSSQDSLKRYDVYQSDGRISGTVASGLRLWRYVMPVVRGDVLWAVARDEMDVPYVVRARIQSASGRPAR